MILIAFGTRPEWIKLRPVIDKMLEHGIPCKIIFTGQHRHLIDPYVFTHYQITTMPVASSTTGPDNKENRLNYIVREIMRSFQFNANEIKYVMVQGDTTSAFGIALAAFHSKIPVIHLEAGLRTYDHLSPYPEEFNRQAIGAMADVNLCPTKTASDNLIREGKDPNSIYIVGNTVLDNLSNIKAVNNKNVLITMHRRENHKKLARWFIALDDLAGNNPDLNFILPIHPNPDVIKYKDTMENVQVLGHLVHSDLINILKSCQVVITDSGGLQEEAAFLRIPCVVCRKTTERSEGLNQFSWICDDFKNLEEVFDKVKDIKIDDSLRCPYGSGDASDKIIKIIKNLQNV